MIYIYGMLLRRRELYAEFLALSRLVPLTFTNVFDWSPHPQQLVGAEGADARSSGVTSTPTPTTAASRLALAENLRHGRPPRRGREVLAPLPASDPDARAIRVRLALDRGDDRKAEALLAEGPTDHAELARLRGRLRAGRAATGPAAVKHFRAAYKAEPDDRDTLFGLGQALTLAGDRAAAAPYLDAARKLDAVGALIQRAAVKSNQRRPGADPARSAPPARRPAATPRPSPGTTSPSRPTRSTPTPRRPSSGSTRTAHCRPAIPVRG